jgi:condensin complex subunit 1
MASINFDINDALKHYMSDPASIPTPEADSVLVDCENDPEALTNALILPVLDPIVDAIAESPDAITRSSHLDSLQFLLKFASFLPTHALSKIFDLITSGLSAETDAVHHDLESNEQDLVAHHKTLLEIYGFLLQWTIAAVETKAAEKSSAAPAARGRGKPKSKKAMADDGVWDSASQLQVALDALCRVLRLKLGKIFLTTSERDTFTGLITRPVYLVLESEQRVKTTTIRMHAFKVLCMAVKHHGHGYGTFVLPPLWDASTDRRQPRKYPSSRT